MIILWDSSVLQYRGSWWSTALGQASLATWEPWVLENEDAESPGGGQERKGRPLLHSGFPLEPSPRGKWGQAPNSSSELGVIRRGPECSCSLLLQLWIRHHSHQHIQKGVPRSRKKTTKSKIKRKERTKQRHGRTCYFPRTDLERERVVEFITGWWSSVDLGHFAGPRLRKHRHPHADLSFDFF